MMSSLPALPVGDLAPALRRLRRSLDPFISGYDKNLPLSENPKTDGEKEKEGREIDALIADFGKPGGPGERLRAELVKRQSAAASETPVSHWLERWWDATYFEPRGEISWWINYYFDLEGISQRLLRGREGVKNTHLRGFEPQVRSAALCVQAMAGFHTRLQTGRVAPDTLRGSPLDMESYRFMFGAYRIPVRGGPDELFLRCQDLPVFGGPAPDVVARALLPRHIAVACRGFLFAVGVVDEFLAVADAETIASRLAEVRRLASAREADGLGIGAFSSEPRDRAAEMFGLLESVSPRNRRSLEMLRSSLFFVALDDDSPASDTDRVNRLIHGPAANRCFDKSLQLIVFRNGEVGLNGEHSKLDGLPVGRLSDEMFRDIELQLSSPPNPVRHAAWPVQAVSEMVFDMNSQLQFELSATFENVARHVARFNLAPLNFRDFGMKGIKKFGISPDAFVQQCLQLAYARCYGRIAAAYESGATKTYFKGRTEVVRSCTPECVEFVQTMQSPSVSDKERYLSLMRAGKAHLEYMRAAVKNNAVDRLLFGMKNLALENGEKLHPLFEHPVMAAATNFRLSTSQLPSATESFSVGYGPMTDEGVGVCYCPRRESIKVEISALSKDPVSATQFASALSNAFRDVAALCAREAPAPAAKL
jgi:carnitine O-acetyltransferase